MDSERHQKLLWESYPDISQGEKVAGMGLEPTTRGL